MRQTASRGAGRWARAAAWVALAVAPATHADEVDALFQAARTRDHVPGAALLVVRDAQVQRVSTYGYANLEHDVPVRHDTLFQSGSLGKQFTAAAVLLLQERGRLSLGDPVAKYLGPVPDAWRGITVRELLDHTAGLHDTEEDGGEIFDLRREYTDEELVRTIASYPLNYPPGTRWKYSNSGYILAGILVTRLTGRFYGDFLASEIFRPLGMRTARIISDRDIVRHRAAGYLRTGDGVRNQDFASAALNATADGSLYLSVDDWAAWIAAMDRRQLLSPASWEALWARTHLADGSVTEHGFCFDPVTVAGIPALEFDGSWQGFRTALERDPATRTTVVVLMNLADTDPLPLARAALSHALDSGRNAAPAH
ncbi:MAG: beta-lactamase family protein [Proteobacteria bacterium]|nr:beta-lactamase family protein [Pseudomonadota bacterium]